MEKNEKSDTEPPVHKDAWKRSENQRNIPGPPLGPRPGQKALGVPSLAPKEVSDDKAGPTQAQAGSPLAEMPSQGKEAQSF